MKVYNVNYSLKSEYNSKYIVISDFHGYFNIKLANYIKDIDIPFIIITGDILNGNGWNKYRHFKKFKKFVDIISVNHKVIISLGNHDLWGITEEGFKNFRSLKSENVYPIYNETCIIDNDSFTSFVPDKDCYNYFKQDKKETIDNILKTKFNVPSGNYIKHLVSHNPYHFYHNEVMDKVGKYFDVIEVGHLHNGYIPTMYLHKRYDKILDKGLHEAIKHLILRTNCYKTHLKHKRILARGIAYMCDNCYYIYLPNDKVYCYNKQTNEYSICNKEKLDNLKTPMVITGAINTCLRIPLFYPYVTTYELSNKYKVNIKIEKR